MHLWSLFAVSVLLITQRCWKTVDAEDRSSSVPGTQHLSKKFFLLECEPWKKEVFSLVKSLRLKDDISLKIKWMKFSSKSEVVLSDCKSFNESPVRCRMINNSSCSLQLNGAPVNGITSHVELYRMDIERNSIGGVNNTNNFTREGVLLTISRVSANGHFNGKSELQTTKNAPTLLCYENATLHLERGFAFGYCGGGSSPLQSSQHIFQDWKKRIPIPPNKKKKKNIKRFLLMAVGVVTSLMFLCLVSCIGCRVWRNYRQKRGYVRGRRGSNLSSSVKTKEIEMS